MIEQPEESQQEQAVTGKCHWHPDTETGLSCSQCGKYVCTNCMVQASVGIRCRECGKAVRLPTYDVSKIYYARAVGVALGVAIVGGILWALLNNIFFGIPFRVAEFDIMFNKGISKMGDLLDIGVDQGIIKKAGAFYSYGETRLGQGRENSKEFLAEHSDLAQSLEDRIRGQASTPEPPSNNGTHPDGPDAELSLATASDQGEDK